MMIIFICCCQGMPLAFVANIRSDTYIFTAMHACMHGHIGHAVIKLAVYKIPDLLKHTILNKGGSRTFFHIIFCFFVYFFMTQFKPKCIPTISCLGTLEVIKKQ